MLYPIKAHKWVIYSINIPLNRDIFVVYLCHDIPMIAPFYCHEHD